MLQCVAFCASYSYSHKHNPRPAASAAEQGKKEQGKTLEQHAALACAGANNARRIGSQKAGWAL